MKTIAFFGHRKIFDDCTISKRLMKTLKEIIPKGFSRLLIGSHGDFDKIVLSTCLNYRENINYNIKINVVLTNLSLINKDDNGHSRIEFYNNKNCETFFYDIEEVYFKNRITFSNKRMIDESDLIICYVDMKSHRSGAKTAIYYALKQNKRVINLFKQEDKLPTKK